MSSIEQRLSDLNITLPPAPQPAGSYVPCVQHGDVIYVSGQLPLQNGKLTSTGKVGTDVTIEQAQEAARICTLNGLAILKAQLGDLDRIRQVLRLEVFVNSSPGFTTQPQVANGASDLLVEIFGESGKHCRQAVGVAELPLDAGVELSLTVSCA